VSKYSQPWRSLHRGCRHGANCLGSAEADLHPHVSRTAVGGFRIYEMCARSRLSSADSILLSCPLKAKLRRPVGPVLSNTVEIERHCHTKEVWIGPLQDFVIDAGRSLSAKVCKFPPASDLTLRFCEVKPHVHWKKCVLPRDGSPCISVIDVKPTVSEVVPIEPFDLGNRFRRIWGAIIPIHQIFRESKCNRS
jgi:hypothetical protein